MATIHDVARAANVSISTVSRVLNGSRPVDPALRRAVEEAARTLNYHPNAAARSLRQARTGAIGVVISELSNPTISAIIGGIGQIADRRGLILIVCDPLYSATRLRAQLAMLIERRVDGVIVQPVDHDRSAIDTARQAGIPVVVTGSQRPSGAEYETLVQASFEAYRLLIGLGHRRIALVMRAMPSEDGRDPRPVAPARRTAYRQAFVEAGLPVDESLIALARDADEARVRVRALLARPDRPTALVAGYHEDLPDILIGIQEAGLAIPADISVLAYGDSRWAVAYQPALTVVRLDAAEIGRSAAELLFTVMDGETAPRVLYQSTELIVRGSCAPPRQQR